MNLDDPQQLAEFVNAVAPSVTGGLLALAGVILLFILQQRAQRREARRTRLDLAALHMMETAELLRKMKGSDDFNEMLVASWKFSWLLDKKDAPVARWAFELLLSQRDPKASKRDRDTQMGMALARVMSGLNDWRLGTKKPDWFHNELAKTKATNDANSGS